MRLFRFIFALFFLISCGVDESAIKTDPTPETPEASSGPQLGWMIMPSSSARNFNPSTAAVYYAPSYTPPYSNAPSSYSAPGLRTFNRTLASGANYYTITGGVLGGVPGGVIAGFPTYGGVPAGGALPGAYVGAGTNLGVNFGTSRYSPLARGRTVILRWPPYWSGYPVAYQPAGYSSRGYIAVPVTITPNPRGSNAHYQPRVISSGEPHPVIVFVPTAAGFYQPIVTFRGTT